MGIAFLLNNLSHFSRDVAGSILLWTWKLDNTDMISWEIDAHCLTINHPRVKNLDKSSTYECTYLSNSNLVAESLAKDGLYGLEERSSSFITQGCFHYKNYPSGLIVLGNFIPPRILFFATWIFRTTPISYEKKNVLRFCFRCPADNDIGGDCKRRERIKKSASNLYWPYPILR